jgi:DNA-binding NtrC family response regulator
MRGSDAPTPAYTLWEKMRALLGRLAETVSRGAFVDDCLDLLVELSGADRGLVLLFHDDGTTQAVNARGKNRALDPYEREEISKTILERARSSENAIVCRPLADAKTTESMHALGIAAALAAPIRVAPWQGGPSRGMDARGVLYLDFRDRKRIVGETERELCESAALLLGAVLVPWERMVAAEESLRVLSAREEGGGPTLAELLRFESMEPVRREIASSFVGDSSILVVGESGTGKTQLARAIAEASGKKPVVRATLGGSDDLNTITSELFGHERGSFSGALSRRTGLVEYADGGTLIFDEILNLSPNAQKLLLDFTQFGTYRPLGWEKRDPKRARVRIVSATNGDLQAAMREGRFRQDLYYRIAAVELELPPLRSRRADVPALAEGVLRRIDPARPWQLSVGLRTLLVSPDLGWPGNVRQLESVIVRARERALTEDADATQLRPEHLTPRDLGCKTLPLAGVTEREATDGKAWRRSAKGHADVRALSDRTLAEQWAALTEDREALARLERELIEASLERTGNVVARAARELGVGRTSLLSRLDTLGIGRPARGSRRE